MALMRRIPLMRRAENDLNANMISGNPCWNL